MGATKIEWADFTFNPWIGCTRVSPGCENCYAENLLDKRFHRVKWGVKGDRIVTSDDYWRQPLAWNARAGTRGIRYRVFCASLADVFDDHPSILPAWRYRLWYIIAQTPNLDWMLLTKRPENIGRLLPSPEQFPDHPWPWPNVWLGTSAEDQPRANERIPVLLSIPAAVHFVSAEPMLGPIDFSRIVIGAHGAPPSYLADTLKGCAEVFSTGQHRDYPHIGWVICGGESGKGARPMHPDWARSLRHQCAAAGVPFFFKQWGEHHPSGQAWADGKYGMQQRPGEDITFAKTGKKRAGRLLDGREHNEFPRGST